MAKFVVVHECESFNDIDDKGKPVPGTFHKERYDKNFPDVGVPVAGDQKPLKCPFCTKDVSDATPASERARSYLEGNN